MSRWRAQPRLSRFALHWVPLFICLVMAAACTSAAGPSGGENGQEPIEVYLDVDYGMDGATLVVEGSTNLVNGTVIAVAFFISEYEGMVTGGEAAAPPLERDDETTVQNGRFSITYDLSGLEGWWRGQHIFVVSSGGGGGRQPRTVRQTYGDHFERLDGPNTSRIVELVDGDVREGRELRLHKEINSDGESVTAVPF